jgi:cytochrome c oxidase accessory protein FixG
MNKNRFDYHESRLASTDEHGHRVYVHPEEVKGKWRTRRHILYWILIMLYLVLPWIVVDGNQLVLLNIAKREFHIFGNIFYAHNAPMLLFVLLGIPFFFGFVTSIWGRVWCGWGCPQSVFIDSIFRPIEKLIEGNARKRRELDEGPFTLEKFTKKAIKWSLFLVISLHISHSFLGYFVGTRNLLSISFGSPFDNFSLFIAMVIITGIILFDFGWFREQFCIIACPYGRFQSVMMDVNSTAVIYDYNRGEPRRGEVQNKSDEGDCINCYSCVKSCPTGIDIRRGTQLECIACTNCIDACDNIMEKIGKPKGLIRYGTTASLQGQKSKLLRPRTFVYLAILTGILVGFITTLNYSDRPDFRVLRGGKAPFTENVSTGERIIINNLILTVTGNKITTETKIIFQIENEKIEVVTPRVPYEIKEGQNRIQLFVKIPFELFNEGHLTQKLMVKDETTQEVVTELELRLVGPAR